MSTTVEFDPTTTAAEQLLASPWDALPTVSPTEDDVLTAANLRGWNVRLRAMETVTESISASGVTSHPSRLLVPAHYAVIRDNPFTTEEEVIGVVGSDYTPRQNEEFEPIMQTLLDASGASISAAGDYYGNGKQVFFTMDLPESVLVGGVDRVDHKLTIFTSHDGSMAITPVITSFRTFCANCKNVAISKSASFTKIRHTRNADARLAAAHKALEISWKTAKEFDAVAEKLIATPLPDQTFWEIVKDLYPAPAAKRGETLQEARNATLGQILHGPTNANISGTAWAGLQTVIEYGQHHTTTARPLTSKTINDRAQRAQDAFLHYALTA
jgi:phage/plasmid-like protein (TIGR03299 family)